jgi:hypothetical protein
MSKLYATEAAMIACWLQQLKASSDGKRWTVYPETAGWDVLLVHDKGYQLGIEAKLALNPHVVAQSLEDTSNWYRVNGPERRATCGLYVAHLASASSLYGRRSATFSEHWGYPARKRIAAPIGRAGSPRSAAHSPRTSRTVKLGTPLRLP